MSNNRKSKAFSKIVTTLIIAILFSSITISILAWNNGLLGSQNDNVESEIPNEEPTEPNEPTIPEEPEPVPEPEPEVPTQEPTPEPPAQERNNTGQTPDPRYWAWVTVGDREYLFVHTQVETVRPDLFKFGSFSMFDVLVELDKTNQIELEYHFNESMNTHIIDSINGEPYWWYQAYYLGGWSEGNVFRPDHYPWKDGTTLTFYKESSERLESIYLVWKEEVERRQDNGGKLVIPNVSIVGHNFTKTFENVEVASHNLRNDTFQENVITAIDVILSLGDQGKISYALKWYNSIGTASIVLSYWVEGIDDDFSFGTSGFVYEAGASRISGNHIHLPSDVRILNSPEYVNFFWINI